MSSVSKQIELLKFCKELVFVFYIFWQKQKFK
ncbi:MAG: hypothetical protein AWT59_0964 [Candidatus Gallionella acididurans]|uniref:Uncharacterized protein n=1 Tax=Candidatus Gallionella acididurans TaxID=1796491 RepID=A0A139BV54_9PROT|nr:MAG: hypothetical protein AWT59_0964 [Candidatus Gallionella acididurans]